MNPYMRKTFRDGVNPGRPHTDHALQAIDDIGAVADRFAAKRQALKGDKNLTDAGKAGALADWVKGEVLRDYAKATRGARVPLNHVKMQREGLGLPALDKGDMVAELRRQEIRALCRKMKPHERLAAANDDPAIRDALLDVTPRVAGLHPVDHARIRADRVHELHGDRLAQLDAIEEDYAQVGGYAATVRKELQEASGLSPSAFAALLEPAERAADSQFTAPAYPAKPTSTPESTADVMFRKDFEALPPGDRAALMSGSNRPTIIDFDFDRAWDAGMATVLGTKPDNMQ